MEKGFITLAVGDISYYEMAFNLLSSYRLHTANPLPFAIFCDRENHFTRRFDKTVILHKFTKSYMDKLTVLSNPIFKENIFIDADCLAYRDLNDLFLLMPSSGVGCFGKKLSINDTENGWFAINDIGEYADRITYIPQMHGGIIFYKKDRLTQKILLSALQIAKRYHEYKFKYFDQPADEPILALSIAANHGYLIEVEDLDSQNYYVFFPSVRKVYSKISTGKLSYLNNKFKQINNVYLCHWQNCNTQGYQYLNEVERIFSRNKISSFIKVNHNILVYYCHKLSQINSRALNHIKNYFKNKLLN